MRVDHLWSSDTVRSFVAQQDPGGLIRVGRERRGWRQADLGARIGCSASTVSRMEKKGRPAVIALIMGAAREVGVPTNVLAAALGLSASASTRVATDWPPCAEEDSMRRRTLLTAAGLAAPATLLMGLETALASTPDPTGSPAPLNGRLARARSYFDGGRHAKLLEALPGLLADSHQAAEDRSEIALARLSATYSLTSQLLTKIGRYEQSRVSAERATLYADWSGSPLVAAAAARELSIVLRHQDQPTAAQRHILDAVTRVESTGLKTDAQASAYAQMLCTTSYTAARAGNRGDALAMISEAGRAARDLPNEAPVGRLFPVAPAAVRLYAVGVHWALGDAGAALEAGRGLRAGQFKTPERQARLPTDLGRAFWQWGKPEQATQQLLLAARISHGEVRDRPAISRIVGELISRHPRVSGVRELAAVVGPGALPTA
ncbi:helix-turn-helix transcriptional regulator [Streptomyces sp. R-74717]|uniref:helix-turn-helix domain-containing protein n=1 Tax=Streptomyces sp. R-74717 TaxID=2969820 RepID=UPI0039B399CF